jgi:hypothetical protein
MSRVRRETAVTIAVNYSGRIAPSEAAGAAAPAAAG